MDVEFAFSDRFSPVKYFIYSPAEQAKPHSHDPTLSTTMSLINGPSDELIGKAVHSLFAELSEHSYSHACPTPETQELTMRKRKQTSELAGEKALLAQSLHDVWAWSIPVTVQK